jgi:glutamate-5-semialdehyde dehydrogenase
MTVEQAARAARQASYQLSSLKAEVRNAALLKAAEALENNREAIFQANREDLRLAGEEGLSAPLLARLAFPERKLRDVTDGLRSLSRLPDPLGKTLLSRELADGLRLYRVTCPIGVLGIVFESRPDALVQIASLALKSGNAVLLKGGREALGTNEVLFSLIDEAARSAGVPEGWAHLLRTREDVSDMLSQEGFIDLLIPRGSNAFVRYIMDHTHIPVMGHADGLCHVYVDESADIAQALCS